MPETYKSIGTILGSTAATTIYSGVTGTAIVNSVYFSNIGTGGVSVTLNVVKGSTSYTLISNGTIPVYSAFQPIDSPIVLESNNTLRATASNSSSIHAFVSILEIT
jgi:hypothetical protein